MSAMSRHFRGTGVTEYLVGMLGSLRLDVGCFDHLAPLLGFIGKELAEFRGRHRQRHSAEVGQSSLYPWIRKRSVDSSVELIEDFRRDDLGRTECNHKGRFVARQEIANGW